MATAPKSMEPALSGYHPLPSVWHGNDADLLEMMLGFYPAKEPKDILDATVNAGRFWKKSKRRIVGLDLDPQHNPDVLGDNRNMPFPDDSFDVVVYDPPHTPTWRPGSCKDFGKRFGLSVDAGKDENWNLSFLYPPFMAEAKRVLRPKGILFCKIADYVNCHRYQWAHIDLVLAGRDAGLTACDLIVKARKGPIILPKWKVAHHSRRQHCYWIVFRNSKKCER